MTAIYHITHLDNLPGLLARGSLLCDSAVQATGLQARGIAYGNIKERRRRTSVWLAPGGVVADYVPFYFCPRSPMLYALHGGSVVDYTGGQRQVLHLVADAERVHASGAICLYSDGNAASQPLRFFPGVAGLIDNLAWDVINSRSWRDTAEDNDRKRRKQAEFLVYRQLSWSAIERIGVIDEAMAVQVRGILAGQALAPALEVHRDWYY